VQHDGSYKRLFAHRRMVQDLLEGFIQEPWVEELDFATLELVKEGQVSEGLEERRQDLVWRVRWGDKELYLYLLLEFQSTPDPWMALRVLVYVGLLLQWLVRELRLEAGDRLPPVLPLVLYNGLPSWKAARSMAELITPVPGLKRFQPQIQYWLIDEQRYDAGDLVGLRNLAAALFRLEQGRGPEDLREVVVALKEWLREPESRELQRDFVTWLTRVLIPARIPGQEVPAVDQLQEFQSMLEQNVIDWTRQWKQEGLEEGLRQGLRKGRREGIQKGIQKGLETGRREGEAALLLSMLEHRFGPLETGVKKRIARAQAEQLLLWGGRLLSAERLEEVFDQKPER